MSNKPLTNSTVCANKQAEAKSKRPGGALKWKTKISHDKSQPKILQFFRASPDLPDLANTVPDMASGANQQGKAGPKLVSGEVISIENNYNVSLNPSESRGGGTKPTDRDERRKIKDNERAMKRKKAQEDRRNLVEEDIQDNQVEPHNLSQTSMMSKKQAALGRVKMKRNNI